jgi:L-alanine-DL-glutamate epimerase-like enolase superfamily enzyme
VKATIDGVRVKAYRIPTDAPEADGTYRWESTTLVVVHCRAGGTTGIGYSYADAAAANLVQDKLAGAVCGMSACNIPQCWCAMIGAVRNLGEQGIAMLAISAVDTALWDLKAKLMGLPLVDLLGGMREPGAGLWQRRLHLIYHGAVAASVGGLGGGGHPAGEDEDRQ